MRSQSSFTSPLPSVKANATTPRGQHYRSPSLADLPDMAADVTSPGAALSFSPSPPRPITPSPSSLSAHTLDDEHELSTLPDPRSRTISPIDGHPDLNDEVATLSNKLINAINHQTTLGDTLSAARMELEDARATIKNLEARLEEQRVMLSGDVWVRRKTVESDKAKLLSRVAEEKKARAEVEQQKKKIELELENLTTALFEEANKMVISAKEESQKEQEVLMKKNDLLRSQLADTEGLLKSQHDQLAELKAVMEQMGADRDDLTALTTPSSPGFSKFDPKDDDTPLSEGASQAGMLEPISPSYPTSFTHLVQPVLRTDLSAYQDFMTLVHTTKKLVRSRPPSGTQSAGAMSALGLSLGHSTNGSNASAASMVSASASSTPSLPQTPNSPASGLGITGAIAPTSLPPLRDSKFYKRALAEDIEPTLRLDMAPGLSWLARRAVIGSITDGSLVVEPVPAGSPGSSLAAITRPQFFPCALCGESRKEEPHLRTHRFRTSEAESAQRYPLCKSYCLVRLRAVCDFLGFLRLLQGGHWRADDEDAERAAWEESVRLREQMFWARIGGGVVPAASLHQHFHGGSPMLGKSSSSSPREKGGSPRASNEAARRVVSGSPQRPSIDVTGSDDDSGKTTTPVETAETAVAAAAKIEDQPAAPTDDPAAAPAAISKQAPEPSTTTTTTTTTTTKTTEAVARPVTPSSEPAASTTYAAAAAAADWEEGSALAVQIPN
ncbi:hypothetical protein GGTG_04775 [Gaeumannomyces tritici R3-111a-1]|uniref:GDP/GTP exchange factor Sec2 N-terminal domain-containing protein n=1 Tax=Gaeumannomyces tritici (strain R3-111a-1) TaxID=644352 RepID=J3NU24_GAET3|nr:hypothetical protein GGTG_04775 [Gaeumannomyces tritici R3-111a-1]EJT79691.1 hypothetical protein GGTG_04775 [Gaeumannomyces tritici R3-111a-1]